MRYIFWLVYACMFVCLVTFSLQNAHIGHVQYYLGFKWIAPTYLIILSALLVGVFLGILSSISIMIKQRKRITELQANNKSTRA